jgi:hypothetical protein
MENEENKNLFNELFLNYKISTELKKSLNEYKIPFMTIVSTDRDGNHDQISLAIYMVLCRESYNCKNKEFSDAFGITCYEESLAGPDLRYVFEELAYGCMSSCFALIISVNTGLADRAYLIPDGADYPPITVEDIEGIAADLIARLPGFESFYDYLRRHDEALKEQIRQVQALVASDEGGDKTPSGSGTFRDAVSQPHHPGQPKRLH